LVVPGGFGRAQAGGGGGSGLDNKAPKRSKLG